MQRRIYSHATDVEIRPLNEEKAVQAAVDLIGELFVFSVVFLPASSFLRSFYLCFIFLICFSSFICFDMNIWLFNCNISMQSTSSSTCPGKCDITKLFCSDIVPASFLFPACIRYLSCDKTSSHRNHLLPFALVIVSQLHVGFTVSLGF